MNKTSKLLNRKRSSFLAFVAIAAMAMFAMAPAAMAQVPFFFGNNGLDFNNNDVVCDRFTGECFRVGDFNNNIIPIDNGAPGSQEFSERRITSGAANPTTRISNTGDNVNLCAPVQQVSNTGNVANEQGVVEGDNGFFPVDDRFRFVDGRFGFFPVDRFGFGFDNGDLDLTGSEINIEPSATAECTQTIEQAAAA
jgi:hypothetical protein